MSGAGDIHSTGRGGAGNIGRDDTPYTDGSIVREGVYGESGRPEYSAGRGGAGNMTKSPNVRPVEGGAAGEPTATSLAGATGANRPDADVVPETALRGQDAGGYHTGRGGQGNAHKLGEKAHEGQQKEGFVHKVEDKVKNLLHKENK